MYVNIKCYDIEHYICNIIRIYICMYIILIILCKQMRSTPTKLELTQVTVNSTFTPWGLPTIGGTTQKYNGTFLGYAHKDK